MTKQAERKQPADDLDSETLSYGDALSELEELLDELEGADIDVDILAQRVARGAQLVRYCRARLDIVTNDVDQVVAELISVDGEHGQDSELPEDTNQHDNQPDNNDPDNSEPDDSDPDDEDTTR